MCVCVRVVTLPSVILGSTPRARDRLPPHRDLAFPHWSAQGPPPTRMFVGAVEPRRVRSCACTLALGSSSAYSTPYLCTCSRRGCAHCQPWQQCQRVAVAAIDIMPPRRSCRLFSETHPVLSTCCFRGDARLRFRLPFGDSKEVEIDELSVCRSLPKFQRRFRLMISRCRGFALVACPQRHQRVRPAGANLRSWARHAHTVDGARGPSWRKPRGQFRRSQFRAEAQMWKLLAVSQVILTADLAVEKQLAGGCRRAGGRRRH